MTDTLIPDLPTLAKVDAAGIIGDRYPALRLELARIRAEACHGAAMADELARAEAEHARRIAAARVVCHALPTTGTTADAMVVSLRGTVLARDTIDGTEHTYELSGAVGFVAPALWERLGVQIHDSLRLAT